MFMYQALAKYNKTKLTHSLLLIAESCCCFLIASFELSSLRTTAASVGVLPSTALWLMTVPRIETHMDTTNKHNNYKS